jgi:acetolactate synthase-1/2/3 large subunit
VTRWNTQLDSPDIIHESVRKAFKLAEYEKPGATHLEFPEDIAAQETEMEPLPQRERVRRPDPDIPSIDRLQELLDAAERPLIITGNGAVRTDAAEQLRELVELTDYPVAATYMGKGAVSDADLHSLMTLDSGEHQEASEAISKADLIITVGYDIAEHDPAGWNPQADATIVHIDSEPAEVYQHYNPDLEIVADLAATLQKLIDRCEAIDAGCDTGWYRALREHILEDVTRKPDEDEPFTVAGVLPFLREVMADEDVLISDFGSHKMAIAQNYPTYEPNTCIISNGLAAMGISVPGGIAADLAVDGNVVAATGDGGFLMNAAEIDTATRLNCEYTILVFNDNDYGLISEKQIEHTGEHFGTELTNPDIVAFAESFGIDAYRPAGWNGLKSVLVEVTPTPGMALVEIPLELTS